jgi:predicted transcriptional regulator
VLTAEKPRRRYGAARRERTLAPEPLTEQQFALMQVLWASGESTARELTNHLDPALAASNVTALLGQLERKGVVVRRVTDRQHRYRARVGLEEIQRDFVEHLVSVGEELFEGDLAALVCRLVRVRDVNAEGLARVIELLRQREREIEGVRG